MSGLADRDCLPCRGGAPPLGGDAVADLLEGLEGWEVVAGHHLAKSYAFEDFAGALAMADRIGALADAQGHHPDLRVAWGSLGVEIWTHKIRGLTESDFILAAKIDAL